MLTVGIGFTWIVKLAVPIHPAAVPVTVYDVTAAGVTVTGFVVPRLLLHVYAVAPLAVSTVEFPTHILLRDAEMLTIGTGFTVIVALATFEHPFKIPVTVKVVVVAGVTKIWLEFPSPWLHEYIAAPAAVSVTELPAQI